MSSDEEDDSHQLQEDALDLLNHYAHGLDFLADLPTVQLNAAVSKKKLPTDKGTVLKADADSKKGKGRRQQQTVNSDSEEDDEEEEDWEKARRLPGGGGGGGGGFGFRNIEEEARAPALPIKTLEGQLKKASILESDVKKQPKLPFKRIPVVKAGSDDDDDDDAGSGSGSGSDDDDDAGEGGGIAMLMKQAVSVAGITIQDDLEEELKRQKQEKAAAAKRVKEEAIAAAKNRSSNRKTAASAGDDQNKKQNVLQELAAFVNVEDRREEAKQRIAVAAQSLLALPESSLPHLRTLLELSVAPDLHIARLAMLSCVAVFIDILPGYRIRLPTEKELEIQVSKEVQKLRDYESALLRAYQAFLKILLRAVNGSKGGQARAGHGRVALRCMCNLLTSLAHFNYMSDLLQVIVPNSAAKDEKVQKMCCEALTKLLSSSTADNCADSSSGSVITEAVQLLADMLKRRKCICSPEVMTPLLSLQFSDITSAEDFEATRERNSSKKKKKKNKKNGKNDEVDRDFQEAQAVVDLDSRKKAQSATIEAMFEAFFRVLKATTSSGLITSKDTDTSLGVGLTKERFDKRFPLLYPTLQGLEKYAYLISIDYFPDLVAELELLLASETLPPRMRLRCLLTVAQILKGQGEALTVDRKAFYLSLYAALQLVVPCQLYDELEEEEEEGNGNDAEKSKNTRNNNSNSNVPSESESAENLGPLLCKVLEVMILETKLLDTPRLAAFARRIAICASAATDSGTALGLLCILYRMLRKHPKVRTCLLENELGGPSGVKSLKMDAVDPGEAGALAVPLWELSFLGQYHYHPHVAKAAGDIACMIGPTTGGREGNNNNSSSSGGGIGGSSILPLALTPSQLAARTSTTTGSFTPAPAKPAPGSSSSKNNKKRKTHAKLYNNNNGSSFEEKDEEEDPGFGRYFKTVKRYTVNASLRRENDLLMAKLKLFKDHLSSSSSAANTTAVDMKKKQTKQRRL